MFNWFSAKPLTASDLGKLGAAAKRNREREAYKAFHDDMARKAGTKIRWAE